MTVRDRIGIAIPIVALVVVIALTVGIHKPKWTRLMSLADEVAYAEQLLDKALDYQSEFENTRQYLPRASGTEGDADQRFLTEFSAEIAQLGLYLRQLEPQRDERISESYFGRTYMVELDGDYESILELIAYLEDLPEVVEMTSLDVRSNLVIAGKGHRTLMTFKVSGY